MRNALAAIVVLAAFAPAFPAFSAADNATVRPVHRIDPEFPRWAFRAGVNRGVVSARVTVDADGRVTAVEIVNAEPKRLFDEAVVQALSQWRYVEGRAGRTIDVEIAFAR